VVELNRAVAVAQVGDPAAALCAVDRLGRDGYLYLHSTRGELLRRLGRDDEARAAYRRALAPAASTPGQRFLTRRPEDFWSLAVPSAGPDSSLDVSDEPFAPSAHFHSHTSTGIRISLSGSPCRSTRGEVNVNCPDGKQ
jgi:hypothetical protein